MKKKSFFWLLSIVLITTMIVISVQTLSARTKNSSPKVKLLKQTYPDNMFDLRYHDVGQLYLPITNYGIHGQEIVTSTAGGVWPKGSSQTYIFGGGIWVGAIKDGNKLVSVGYNPNSGQSELVPGFVYDETHNYDFDPERVRILISTDYPSRIEEENLPDWPFGYYHPDPDGDPSTDDADTVATWAEAGEGYKPVTVSVQDSYAWFSDVDQTYKLDASADILGIRVIQQGYAWNYFFNQNFVFLTYDIINASDEPLTDTYIGVVVDPDIGNISIDDMVGFDETRNLGYTYDSDGREEGWSTSTGYVGYVFLESPIDPTTGEQLGLTAFRIFTIAVDPGTDVERYDVMAANGTFDVDAGPQDKRFCMPTGPFTLEPGDTARVVVGILCANDLPSLQAACDLAQQMYDEGWVSPSPPPEPKITLVPKDGEVIIVWDNKAETALDPVTKEQDFEGYRLYKSRTGIGPLGNWNPADPTTEWQLIAQWDLANGILDAAPINAADAYNEYHPYDKYLGDDTGIAHLFRDTDVINGVEYHYAITSYDRGTPGLRSLECGLILNQNRASVRPGFYKMGYENPKALTAEHTNGNATCELPQVVISPLSNEVLDAEYEIGFQILNSVKSFSITNLTNGNVVVSNSTSLNGEQLYFNGVYFTIQDEPSNGNFVSGSWLNTTNTNWSFDNFFALVQLPVDYEIRFTTQGSSTAVPANFTIPFEIWRIESDSSYQARSYFLFNSSNDTTEEMQNSLTNGDQIKILEDFYDLSRNQWRTAFTMQFNLVIPDSGAVSPQAGDVFKMTLSKQFTAQDKYVFQTFAEKVSPTKAMLDDIKVVPNPYIVRNTWERSGDYSRLQFVNLPEVCTIRVFTLAGDHVRTIEHNENTESDKPGWEWWDLLTHNNSRIASGIYIYHVDIPGIGEHIGKFAIVR